MKKKTFLSSVVVITLLLQFSSCSNENALVEKSSDIQQDTRVITGIENMSEASQEAIKQARQIDSPYMQNILKTLESTVNDLSPEDIPQFTLLEAPMSPTVTDGATRAVSYTTAYGFDDCFTTLSPIKFKVTSYDTSAFRQSNLLGNVFYYDKDLDYNVICVQYIC